MSEMNNNNSKTDSFVASISRIMGNLASFQRIVLSDEKAAEERARKLRTSIARSKSGVAWGPTHSFDSDDAKTDDQALPPDVDVTHEDSSSDGNDIILHSKSAKNNNSDAKQEKGMFQEFWACANEAAKFVHDSSHVMCNPFDKSPTSKRKSGKEKSKKDSSSSSSSTDKANVIMEKMKASTLGTAANDLFAPPPPPESPSPTLNPTRKPYREFVPFENIAIDKTVSMGKTVSELTVGSTLKPQKVFSSCRRMAYYAVGKHLNTTDKEGKMEGGNRRCYFTGQLIRGGVPFYAGSVQQELKTLVVFCVPSALGLPKKEDVERVSEVEHRKLSKISGVLQKINSSGSVASDTSSDCDNLESDYTVWVEDGEGNLCERMKPEFMLQALPDPNVHLMMEMEKRYPEQFQTLPTQVRSHKCWRLYIKFCFFSGLPIADGEVYFKVNNQVANILSQKLQKAGIDEIILSHEVMEAVNGDKAENMRLPNKKTFQYLQKHYAQQCAKLSSNVFDQNSWEIVIPEV